MYNIEKTWPKWKINKTIGEGSFGKVFEIVRNEYGIEEHSALKVIAIPQSDGEIQSLRNDGMTESDTTEYFKGIVNDFVQEIQLMTKLKGNPNIVGYEDFAVIEKESGIGYEILIRMELLTGLPFYLRENRFRVYDVIKLGIDMCKALETCRELNIVHRDIKPDNIFVASNSYYKLGDFGVARTIEKTMAGLSRKGTYSYMAPEIYNGSEYGFEADIYSLGIVLYKLLNNNRDPFLPPYPAPVKYSDKTEAMVKRIQGLEMPSPVNSDEKLSSIVLKACAHNPANRYQHPKELRIELEQILEDYAEITNEIFSENGINYYTNNSTFSSIANNNSIVQDNNSDASVEDDENTVLIVEDEDEATVIDPNNFANNVIDNNQAGSEQEEKSIKEEKIIKEENVPQEMSCPSCGKPIKSGNIFCGHCGTPLTVKKNEREVICPQCGFDMKPGVKFCGKCGFKL